MQASTVDSPAVDFKALAVQVREAGLLDRRPGYYFVKIALTVAGFVAGWVALVGVGDSWMSLVVAAFLGVMFTQLGFVGHDAGHQQVFGSRRANQLLGLTVGNAMIGLSFGWWVPKHAAHHAHPNQLDRDPDIGEGLVRVNSTGLSKWLTRWQAGLFFPLMLFRTVGMHGSGIQRLLRRRDRPAAVEGILIAAHIGLYLAIVFWVLSPVKAIAFIGVQQGLFGLYLGCSFAPNHKGMPILDERSAMGFAQRQVVTSRNITGGRLIALLLGGLNYQIEHHLFPTMPRPNLARAQRIIRPFCIESSLGYCEDTLVGSYRQAVRSLGSGAARSDSGKSAPVMGTPGAAARQSAS